MERLIELQNEVERLIPKRDALRYHTNQATVSVGFLDRVDVYLGLGAAQFLMQGPVNFSIVNAFTHENFVWEGGGRALLIFWQNTALGVSAAYQVAYPDLDWITYDAAPGSTENTRVQYSQWQVAVGISHKLGILSPYIGGSYSFIKYQQTLPELLSLFDDSQTQKKYTGYKKISLILGASITGVKGINLDIELKTFAEKSLTTSATLRF